MENRVRQYAGIIHIGTVNMAMKIISYTAMDDMTIIENVSQEVEYGEEVFKTHHVSFRSLNEICRILNGFKQLLRDYDVQDVRVITTTAIREADNMLNALDQIKVRTGFKVEVVHMAKEIYYKFFGLYYHVLKGTFNFAGHAVLLVDITSGGMGLTCWQDDHLLFQQNVYLGSLRIMENFTQRQREDISFPTAAREFIHGSLAPLWANVHEHDIRYIVLSGKSAVLLGKLMHIEPQNGATLIRPQMFRDFVESFHGLTPLKLMQRFKLSEGLANVLMPTFMLYYELFRTIEIDMIVLMSTTFTEGYSLYYVAEQTADPYVNHQRGLLLDLARTIAGRYLYNPDHSARVESYAAKIFQALYQRCGLAYHTGYLLRLAAILHETGKFINMRKHRVCSYELIRQTDLFNITDEEKEIVASVASYIDPYMPSEHADWVDRNPTPGLEVLISKLQAIFSLADAIDKSHTGKIKQIRAVLGDKELRLYYQSELDISLERWSFIQASRNFEEIFGITPRLLKGQV